MTGPVLCERQNGSAKAFSKREILKMIVDLQASGKRTESVKWDSLDLMSPSSSLRSDLKPGFRFSDKPVKRDRPLQLTVGLDICNATDKL